MKLLVSSILGAVVTVNGAMLRNIDESVVMFSESTSTVGNDQSDVTTKRNELKVECDTLREEEIKVKARFTTEAANIGKLQNDYTEDVGKIHESKIAHSQLDQKLKALIKEHTDIEQSYDPAQRDSVKSQLDGITESVNGIQKSIINILQLTAEQKGRMTVYDKDYDYLSMFQKTIADALQSIRKTIDVKCAEFRQWDEKKKAVDAEDEKKKKEKSSSSGFVLFLETKEAENNRLDMSSDVNLFLTSSSFVETKTSDFRFKGDEDFDKLIKDLEAVEQDILSKQAILVVELQNVEAAADALSIKMFGDRRNQTPSSKKQTAAPSENVSTAKTQTVVPVSSVNVGKSSNKESSASTVVTFVENDTNTEVTLQPADKGIVKAVNSPGSQINAETEGNEGEKDKKTKGSVIFAEDGAKSNGNREKENEGEMKSSSPSLLFVQKHHQHKLSERF